MTGPTREQAEEWVRDAGLDWHRGFTFEEDDANRYETLAVLAFAAGAEHERERIAAERERLGCKTCAAAIRNCESQP